MIPSITKHVKRTPENCVVSQSGEARWLDLMRKFRKSREQKCWAESLEEPPYPTDKKYFATGSSYEGSYVADMFNGRGTYTYACRKISYEGEFNDGLFHGKGKFKYSDGNVLSGKFVKGKLTFERKLIFGDELQYMSKNWNYCKKTDRRYTREYDLGLQPAGDSLIAHEPNPMPLEDEQYDVGFGICEPAKNAIFKYSNINEMISVIAGHDKKWVKANCRHSPDKPCGPIPYLYEKWPDPELEVPFESLPAAPTVSLLASGMDMFDINEDNEEDVDLKLVHRSSYETRLKYNLLYSGSNPVLTGKRSSHYTFSTQFAPIEGKENLVNHD